MSTPMIAPDPVEEREQFLAERRTYVGASEVAAVLGLDPNKTPLQLYNEKLGLAAPFLGNKHTQRGQKLEDIAAREFMESTGLVVRRDRRRLVHPVYPFIQGHLDRRVQGTKRPVEIKNPSRGMFYKVQRTGLQNSWIFQGQTYMALDGSDALHWAVFCADAWELADFEQKADPEIQKYTIEKVVEFWTKNVMAKVPPKPTRVDKEIEKIVTQVGGDLVSRVDADFVEAAQLVREAMALRDDGAELYELAKSKMLGVIEEKPGRYEAPGVLRFCYYEVAGRKTLDKDLLKADNPELDLTQYEKVGKPYATFRPVVIGGD